MDRVSGWYKRRTQWWLFVVGLGATLAINVDTSMIAEGLANDSALRASVVAAAQAYVVTNPAPGTTPMPDPASEFASCQQDANSPACRVDQNTKRLEELGLPIGWDNPRSTPSFEQWGQWLPLGWLLKLLGGLMTAFAVTLGAPFWFDLLNKFLVIRSTVKPTEKSPEEKSED